jgi:type II secretory pathway component GspD/PulD (secretin)
MKKLAIFIFFLILSSTAFGQSADLEVKIFKLKSPNAKTIYHVVESLKGEDGKMSFDPNTNSLIVVDTPVNLERIGKTIKELDVNVKQLEVEVTIAEVSEGFLKDAGIRTAQIIIPSAEMNIVLNLLNSQKDSRIRSKSMIRTMSNQPARINITEDTKIGEERIRYPSDVTVTIPIRKEIGSVLEVLPIANNDNTIMLYVRPSLSNLEGSTSGITERAVATQTVINNGDTVIIGNLDSVEEATEKGESIFGIPTFRTIRGESKRTIIFLTARIIE